ncbi:MAG: FtsX-like permease family protein [Blautia sp.]|nr:FtsX-like permease family protein [Blautia sp.]
MSKRKMFFKMITASLVRRRSRMLVALLAIAVGATILSGLVTIYIDVPRQMGAEMRNYGANMIFMASSNEAVFDRAAVEKGAALIPPDQVVGVSPYRYETVRIHEQPVVAAGTDIEQVRTTSPYWMIEGDWPSVTGDMLVGQDVAESLGLGVGDTVNVMSSDDSKEKDSEDLLNLGVDMKITGLLDTGGSEENYVYIAMEDLEGLVGPGELDVAELSISATADELSKYVDTIDAEVEEVTPRLVKRVTESESTVLTKLQALVFLVTAVVLVLTMICVATTMAAVVAERRKEIGLRKALGASDSSIIREFMGEGLLLGLVGGIVGAILGFLFAQFVSVRVFASSITFQPLMLPVTIIVSILITGAACLFPVRNATKIDPALVLKGE